ncbi:MAG: MFS transporter [Desulfobulbaceae bacterium]
MHYGWLVVAAGCLCIFACLGLGRFAIGMLLPAMGESLGLTYSQMGLISTGNFFGYLLAVLTCGRMQETMGARRLIFFALTLIALSTGLIGLADGYVAVTLLYTLTGIGSGAANVPMMGLVTAWFAGRLRGRAAGFVVIGSGFAILASGFTLPVLNALGEEGWRLSWFALAATVFLISVVCRQVLRDRPAELGLHRVGGEDEEKGAAARTVFRPFDPRVLVHCGTIYFIFGFTYVIYATFIVTVLVNEYGFAEKTAGHFWSWVGVLSLFSGPVFGTLSDRVGRATGLTLVFAIQAIAYLLVGLHLPGPALAVSIGCFGIVAWSVPTIMIALVGDLVGAVNTVRTFGVITFIFGLGQILGPYLAGLLAERNGDFSTSFLMASALTLLAAAISWRFRNLGKKS